MEDLLYCKDCTHPFPLSSNMGKLRKLKLSCNIGVAHNGIIQLTSTGYNKTITYNDTMEFITDYLALIIKSKDYYKDKDTLILIDRLVESRLAILDGSGHCELIGKGWTVDEGIYYSNSSYKPYKPFKATKKASTPKITYTAADAWDDPYFDIYGRMVDDAWDEDCQLYNFLPPDCPMTIECDDSFCEVCKEYPNCYNPKTIDEEDII